MADFDLTQTDAQVQSILNDGQNMQGAGAQTTLTTESVLLKDVNGNYHKILKSSFTEAIRDTLAGLLVNNDKGTTINQIAAIASGDFGSITPANLASVLGVGNCVKVNQYVVDQTRNISSQTPLVISFTVNLSTKGQVVLCLSRNFFNRGVTAFITLGYNDAYLGGSVITNSGSEDLSIEFEAVSENSIKVTCTALSGNAFGRLVATEIQKVGDVSYS